MKWRKWNNIFHRDLGYLAVGLTIIYSVSGIAVNHVADWNPSYKIERTSFNIDVSSFQSPPSDEDISQIVSASKLSGSVESTFMVNPHQIRIFLENQTLDVNLESGEAELESVDERAFLQEFNAMHLNHPKNCGRGWRIFMPLYCLSWQ